jgi:hypothetical protein
VEAGLVNEAGKVIARGKTTLAAGTISFNAGDTTIPAPAGAFGQIDFPRVNIEDLTPTLTVVIAGVNGIAARQISETGYMRIAPGDLARREQEQERRMAAAGFVYIEGGSFQMGSADGYSDERPVHTVTAGNFYMGKYTVTQKEWAEVMGNNPSAFKGDNLPVEQVSWYDAVEYCNRRSEKEGLAPAYTIDKGQRDPNNTSEYDTLKWRVTWNREANGCPRRRNGSTPPGAGVKIPINMPGETARTAWRGIKVTAAAGLIRWGQNNRMVWASMT